MNKLKNIINVSLGNFFEMYDFMVFGLFAKYIVASCSLLAIIILYNNRKRS